MLTGCPVACKQCGNQVRSFDDDDDDHGDNDDDVDDDDEDGDDNEDVCSSAKTTTPTVRLGRGRASAARTKPIWTSTVQR